MTKLLTNNIFVYFLSFSGGKFIANCLALSRHVFCNENRFALQDLKYTVFDQAYYDFKLQSVLHSLPAPGFDYLGWDTAEFPSYPDAIPLGSYPTKTMCHCYHFPEHLERVRNIYPDLKILRLVNFHRFNTCCFLLKSKTKDIERHRLGFDVWLERTSGDFDLNMDQIMYEPETFLPTMKQVYDYFGFDDFDPVRLNIFYQKYRNLHNLD